MEDRAISRLEERILRETRTVTESGLIGLLATPAGRAYFWSILGLTGLFTNPHSANALNTAFACGEQNIGQKLMEQITRLAPESYITMMKESQENDRINSARRDRAAGDSPDTDD